MSLELSPPPYHALKAETLVYRLFKDRRYENCVEVAQHFIASGKQQTFLYHAAACSLHYLGRMAEAEAHWRGGLKIDPQHHESRANLGLLLLLQGNYREGWALFESRYHPQNKSHPIKPPPMPFPQWQGEPLAGKSILIWPEQGLGDEIQFCRFVPLLKAHGAARVSIMCKPPLMPFIATLAGLDNLFAYEKTHHFTMHDYWCFALSPPRYLNITLENLPNRLPYLSALPPWQEKWHSVINAAARAGELKVGLVWKGNAKHPNDANRSLPHLAVLAPLWQVPNVLFYSLQKQSGEQQARRTPVNQPITDLAADIKDFADTAAIISLLDLVICVDTAIAHAAGALGKNCWLLLPAQGTDWRWMLEREDSPWYPRVMRLYRQQTIGHWDAVIARVVTDLARLASG